MKHILSALLFIYFINQKYTIAQSPISPTDFFGQKEIILIYDENSENGKDKLNQQKFTLKLGYEAFPGNERLDTMPKIISEEGTRGQVDIITADFTGNGTEDYIYTANGPNNYLFIRMVSENKGSLHDEVRLDSIGKTLNGKVLKEGDFDGDGSYEFVVAYEDLISLDTKIGIIDIDSENTLVKVHDIEDEDFKSDLAIYNADFDGMGGDDELVVGFSSDDPETGYYVKIYDFDENLLPVAKAKIKVNLTGDASSYEEVSICAGDFDGDNAAEFVAVFGRIDPGGGSGEDDTFLYPFDVTDDTNTASQDPLETIIFYSELGLIYNGISVNEQSPLLLLSGDLNDDSKDEILFINNSWGKIITVQEGQGLKLFETESVGSYPDELGYSVSFATVKDLDGKPGDDLLIVDQYFDEDPGGTQRFNIIGTSFDSEFNSNGIFNLNNFDEISNGSGNSERRNYAIAVGDLNGDNFRIGEGVKYIKTEIIQPLVILNAPPTHFDVFGETVYDINKCYNDNIADCGSFSVYEISQSLEKMVSASVYSDWGVSAEISGGGSFLGIGVEGYMKGTYGERFEKTQNNSQSVNVKTTITASGDDLLYATVTDYEIWEHPVYDDQDNRTANIIAVIPKISENRWFPSKERSAAGYVPKHEVGNILSYTPYTSLLNPDSKTLVRGSYSGDGNSYDLNESSNIDFEINWNNTFEESNTKQVDVGLEVGASVSGWGFEISGSATYNSGQISTHSIKVEEEISVNVHLGPIDRSLGENNFNVTPYIYWANNGALVVDYAVRAILPGAGETATWWSDLYGQESDPAFILPWRNDPEKGLALQDEEKRRQTRSITFTPSSQLLEGDTLTINAVINNFSLKATSAQVPVSFYLGNPDEGGELLTGINGNTIFYTPEALESQSYSNVSMQWEVPAGVSSFPRIYAVIDPENISAEIHENNNIGWAVWGKSNDGGTNIESPELSGTGDKLNIYPNPGNGVFTINTKGNQTTHIKVYELSGKIVYSGLMQNENNVIDLTGLSPGMYIIKAEADSNTKTARLIIQ